MYFPNLKTSDAELRAIRHLSKDIKSHIIPVFELTRSRKTKSNPEGSLRKRAAQLREIYDEGKFILDLSTEPELMNNETFSLFDEDGGYYAWQKFLNECFHENIIPCALYEDGGSKEDFQLQVKNLVGRYKSICIRSSVDESYAPLLYNWATEVTSSSNIFLCCQYYYVDKNNFLFQELSCLKYVYQVIGNKYPKMLIFTGSSFPKSVTEIPGCADDKGAFRALEIDLEVKLMGRFPNINIASSDYASVHPIRYEMKGGSWIPRIDYFDGQNINYVRIRRDQGGYGTAVKSISASSINSLQECWGKEQIALAKTGLINGSSPSYWISVRVNQWITTRALSER